MFSVLTSIKCASGRGRGEAQQQPAQPDEGRGVGGQVLAEPDAFEPLLGDHRTQAAGGHDQRRHHRRPGEIQAQQQAEQHAVVAEQPGLAIGLGIAATLRGEQPGDTAQQRTAEQGGRGEQNGQQAQQTAQRITLEEDLAEAVEQGCRPSRGSGC